MINDELIKRIEDFLTEEFLHDQARLNHIKNVTKVALELGEIFNISSDKIIVASYLHDATKKLSFEENFALASKMFNERELTSVVKPCLHAYSAASLAKDKFSIEDQDILNAITYHCSGRSYMSNLEMIIFISDYIEESRIFVTEELRILARKSLRKATYIIMKQTCDYLLKNNRKISSLTLDAIEKFETQEGGIQ
ncbi:MAG: bis(5'-nucleosyl)-tetraphosphatase (symmetrical) YqeK [Candidatus Izemoplasmatales bacterium]|jgi:predicted HD superfamily hydrolase involved in NAD metabolism|nr:bis(5'-nucleosyl)-tetraphosphatase (symmetrical) YqeK [Candidatus Izemoplasmatales bacterium]